MADKNNNLESPLEDLSFLTKNRYQLNYYDILDVVSLDPDIKHSVEKLKSSDSFVKTSMREALEIAWREYCDDNGQPSIKFLKLLTDLAEDQIDFEQFVKYNKDPNYKVINAPNPEPEPKKKTDFKSEWDEDDEDERYVSNYIDVNFFSGINVKKEQENDYD